MHLHGRVSCFRIEGTDHSQSFMGRKGDRPVSQLYLKVPKGRPEYGMRGVRTHSHKLILTASPDAPMKQCLYDLQEDPYELHNVAGEHPDIVSELANGELRQWLDRTGDPWIANKG